VVARRIAVGHLLREGRLVEARIVEGDRARVDRIVRNAGHRGDDRAGVDAAGQEGPQRHLGDQAQLHRLFEAMAQFRARVLGADGVVEREAHVPVGQGRRHRLAAAPQQRMRGGQLQRLLEHRAWLGDVTEREVLLDGERVERAVEPAVGQHRLQLRAESHPAVVEQCVVHRLDAHPVARQEEALLVLVPESEGEHAAQLVDAAFAPGLPGVHDALGVALRVEHIAQGLQFRHQRLVVVDLAVEDDGDRPVRVEQRLLAGGDVDDRQPTVAHAEPRLDVQAAFIGSTVVLRIVHPLQHGPLGSALGAGVEEAGDSAHGLGQA
jgi:hypothetical protein